MLTEDQARRLLGSVKVARKITLLDGAEAEEPWLVGLRDRALMAVMTYSFARIGAVVAMRVEDYFHAGSGWRHGAFAHPLAGAAGGVPAIS